MAIFKLTKKRCAQYKAQKLVNFVDFGLELRFPGGKAEIGADFRVVVMTEKEVGKKGARLVEPGKVWSHGQAIARTWSELNKSYLWKAPTKDGANEDYENVDQENTLVFVLVFEMLRSAPLPDATVVAQVRGVWNFTHVY